MKYEYIPKGYNSWYQYQKAMRRRRKVVDTIGVVAIITLLVAAYCVCGYIEHL